jgi:hypothetical protein
MAKEALEKLIKIKGAGTIGRSRKPFDITHVHPQFKTHVIKGLL